MLNRREEKYWKLQPLVRDFAESRRLEDTTLNEDAKQWFLTFYSDLLQTMGSMFYSSTNKVLEMFDAHIHNIRLFLRCAADPEWKATIKARPACGTALFQGLLAPNVSYILKLRFQAPVRLAAYRGLHEIIRNLPIPHVNPILGDAEVLLEMAIIQGRTTHESPQLRQALYRHPIFSRVHEAAYEHYRAGFLAVEGSILYKLSKLKKGYFKKIDLTQAENLLSQADRLCAGLRTRSYQKKDTEAYYKWTDHLAWILKELASICGKRPARRPESLRKLTSALDLRRKLSGDDHITLVVLLWKIGDRQATMSSTPKQRRGRLNFLADSVRNLESALDISAYYGCNGQHVSGFIHLSLFRARMQLGEEEKAVTELHKAEEVFRELDDNVYPLKMVRDSWACLKRWKTKRTYVP